MYNIFNPRFVERLESQQAGLSLIGRERILEM